MKCHRLVLATLFCVVCLGGFPPSAPAAEYAKVLGAPDDGRFRPSPDLPGVEEAYLFPLFASSHAANLLLLKSGELLCTWFAGTYEGQSDVAIMLARLPRNGSRWSRPRVVDHRVGESFQNPVLFEAPEGTLWLLHTTQPADRGQSQARVLVTQSKDDGRTWSSPQPLFAEPGAFIRQPLVVMPDGRWLLPMYFTPQLGAPDSGWGGAEMDHSTIKISSDGGSHWSDHPVPESAGLVQPEVLRLRSGGYVAFFRSRFADFIYRSDSADGSTWTPPRPTRLPSNNSSFQVAALSDGEYALAFDNSAARTGQHRPQTAARWPLSVALSEDEGRTWKWVRDLETGARYPHSNAPELPQPDRPGRKEYSYPSIQQGGDGKVYVAYTYLRYTIKVVRFDERWIQGGSTSGLFRGAPSPR